MTAVLLVVWGGEVRTALTRLRAHAAGRLLLGVTAIALLAGATLAAARVRTADAEPFDPVGGYAVRTRINDPAPALGLVDQAGDSISLDRFAGRPVLVTFAFAHCQTVCPVVVHEALEAQRAAADRRPALLVVTLDPWRDTPARLPAIAAGWSSGATPTCSPGRCRQWSASSAPGGFPGPGTKPPATCRTRRSSTWCPPRDD